MKVRSLDQKFDHLYKTFTNESFLKMQALGGEVPFYIAAYSPSEENRVFVKIRQLKERLRLSGVSVLEVSLYDLVIDILRKEEVLEDIIEQEKEIGKENLLETLRSMLDSTTELTPKIGEIASNNPSQILFLTGIGQVFPYIRSHAILNNLQNVIKDRPTVMFFPGIYDSHMLKLFGRLKDDNYYRAFNLSTLNL
jgi:hypothetical protein